MPIPAWPIRPNWRDPVVQNYEYLTQILTSTSGYEQRIAMRQTARRTTEFLVTAADDRYRAITIPLQTKQSELTVVAEYSKSEKTASDSATGSTAFQLQSGSPPSWFEDGASVVLWDAVTDRAETRTAYNYVGDTVYFYEANASPWPAGSKICPGLTSRLGASLSLSQILPKVLEGTLQFIMEPGSDSESNFPAASTIWDGREVFVMPPNWVSGQDVEFTRPQDRVDYQVGTWATYFPHAFNDKVRTVDYLAATRSQAKSILDVFGRARGRRGEFYVPTDFPDIVSIGNIANGATSIISAGLDLLNAYQNDTVRRTICIRLKTGERIFRKLTSITGSIGRSFLNFAEPITSGTPKANIQTISWMPLTRFASDTLTLEWITDQVARTRLVFQALEYRTQE